MNIDCPLCSSEIMSVPGYADTHQFDCINCQRYHARYCKDGFIFYC